MTVIEQELTETQIMAEAVLRVLKEFDWTQSARARDRRGLMVANVFSDRAVSFCLYGAAQRAGLLSQRIELRDSERCQRVANLLGFSSIGDLVNWNDSVTKEEVIAYLESRC